MLLGPLASTLVLFAQAAGKAAPRAADTNGYGTLLSLAPLPILFYFLMIRPQQRQEKARKALIAGMKRGDEVVTQGGVIGRVVDPHTDDIDDGRVVLEIDKGVRVKFTKASIVRVIQAPGEAVKDKLAVARS